MKLFSLFAVLFIFSCGVRKTEKRRLESINSSSMQGKQRIEAQTIAMKTDSVKALLITADNSQIAENQNAEIAADWAQIDGQAGGILLKGNVKISRKILKTTLLNKQSITQIKSLAKEKTTFHSKTHNHWQNKQERKTTAQHQKTTAGRRAFWLWTIIIATGITIIYFKYGNRKS